MNNFFIFIVLFIGTKPQFASVIEKCAEKSSSYYVTQRWLGGMLTNWLTVKTCLDKLESFFDSLYIF